MQHRIFLTAILVLILYRIVYLHNEIIKTDEVAPSPRIDHPTAIVIGTQKGGTSALSIYLTQSPLMVRSIKIEPHYFDSPVAKEHPSLEEYHKHFNMTYIRSNPLLRSYEKTPRYMFIPRVAERITTLAPTAKLIALLRDPVERAYSGYKHHCSIKRKLMHGVSFGEMAARDLELLEKSGVIELFKEWKSKVSLGLGYHKEKQNGNIFSLTKDINNVTSALFLAWEKYVYKMDRKKITAHVVGQGIYAIQLAYYLDAFNKNPSRPLKERLLILKSEDMRPNSDGFVDITAVTDFIGVPKINLKQGKRTIHKGKETPWSKSESVDETKRKLMKFYQSFNEMLYLLLGEGWEHPWEYDIE